MDLDRNVCQEAFICCYFEINVLMIQNDIRLGSLRNAQLAFIAGIRREVDFGLHDFRDWSDGDVSRLAVRDTPI